MNEARKASFFPYIFFLFIFLSAAYFAGGVFTFPDVSYTNFQNYLKYCLQHPFVNWWSDKTPVFLLLAFTIWLMMISYYLTNARRYMHGREHGTACWGDVREQCRKLEDKNGMNRILTQNFHMAPYVPYLNGNILILGGPGSGKSYNVVAPNLLNCAASYVVLDVKGELLGKYGNYLRKMGMRICAINMKDKEESDCYNPFRYVKREDDIVDLVMNIDDATSVPDTNKGDAFWTQAFRLYLQSLFYYVWMEEPHPTMNRVLELMKLTKAPEGEISPLTQLMERLAVTSSYGKEHPAYRDYNKLMTQGAEDTIRSVIVTANARLTFFEGKGIRRIFEGDDLELEFLGVGVNGDERTKTALFIVVEDGNRSYDFLVGMAYTQIFGVLKRVADKMYSGRLPVPVEVWMDEFANGARPQRFEELITTLRSRNIAAMMFLQSLSQLKNLYKNDVWEIFLDGCSTIMYLGNTNSPSTAEFISKKLGKATIDKRTEGESKGQQHSSSHNFDNMARSLMEPDEVERLPKNRCIVFVSGEPPVYDEKYQTKDMPAFKESTKLGWYTHPVEVVEDRRGRQVTIKSPFRIEQLNEQEAAYYRRAQQQGENVRVLSLDMKSFLELNLLDYREHPNLDYEEVEKLFQKNQEKILQMELEERKNMGETIDLSQGDVYDWLASYRLSEEQQEEIIGAIEDGLSDEEIKVLFNPAFSAVRMNHLRRLMRSKEGVEKDE